MWRYRIIRTKPNTYGLYSVYIDDKGAVKYRSEEPEQFQLSEHTEFDGDDAAARALLVRLLSEALADARLTPILSIDASGGLVEADPT